MAWPYSTNCHAILPDIFEKLRNASRLPSALGWPTAPPLHGSSRMTPQPLLERLITRYPRYCNFMGYFTHKSQPVKSLRTVSPRSTAVDVLKPVAHLVVVPLELAQELLQGPWCHSSVERDWFDALLWQVRQLPLDVHGQMSTSILTVKAVIEHLEKLAKFRLQISDLLNIHARSSLNHWWEERFVDLAKLIKANLAL